MVAVWFEKVMYELEIMNHQVHPYHHQIYQHGAEAMMVKNKMSFDRGRLPGRTTTLLEEC